MRTVTYTWPSHWSPYLINRDRSCITDTEQQRIDAILLREKLPTPASCEDAGFRRYHDATQYGVLACDCQDYAFLVKD